ncbi:MAG: bifunctional hydroxymethylpyrimidine kinase/phosphomethylpyrimidine kinase [Candidatus Omnitrophica bacterium]|nr:bifunctional hydroxymethylpyrimidine kinase/phosphomethylpyrimidine kinase [Candidatus Omnitrophota bacterium]
MTPTKRFPTRCLAGGLILALAWPIHPAHAVRATAAQEGTSRAGLEERLVSGPPHDRRTGLEEEEEREITEKQIVARYSGDVLMAGGSLKLPPLASVAALVPFPGENLLGVLSGESLDLLTASTASGTPFMPVVHLTPGPFAGPVHAVKAGEDLLVLHPNGSGSRSYELERFHLTFGGLPSGALQPSGFDARGYVRSSEGAPLGLVFDSKHQRLIHFVLNNSGYRKDLTVEVRQRHQSGYARKNSEEIVFSRSLTYPLAAAYDDTRKGKERIWVLDKEEDGFYLKAYAWDVSLEEYRRAGSILLPRRLADRIPWNEENLHLGMAADPLTQNLVVAHPYPDVRAASSTLPEVWILKPTLSGPKDDLEKVDVEGIFKVLSGPLDQMPVAMGSDGNPAIGIWKPGTGGKAGEILLLPPLRELKLSVDSARSQAASAIWLRPRPYPYPPREIRNPVGVQLKEASQGRWAAEVWSGSGQGGYTLYRAWLDPHQVVSGVIKGPLRWLPDKDEYRGSKPQELYRRAETSTWHAEAVTGRTKNPDDLLAPLAIKVRRTKGNLGETVPIEMGRRLNKVEGELWVACQETGQNELLVLVHRQDPAWKNPELGLVRFQIKEGVIQVVEGPAWFGFPKMGESPYGPDNRPIGLTAADGAFWFFHSAVDQPERPVRIDLASLKPQAGFGPPHDRQAGLEETEVKNKDPLEALELESAGLYLKGDVGGSRKIMEGFLVDPMINPYPVARGLQAAFLLEGILQSLPVSFNLGTLLEMLDIWGKANTTSQQNRTCIALAVRMMGLVDEKAKEASGTLPEGLLVFKDRLAEFIRKKEEEEILKILQSRLRMAGPQVTSAELRQAIKETFAGMPDDAKNEVTRGIGNVLMERALAEASRRRETFGSPEALAQTRLGGVIVNSPLDLTLQWRVQAGVVKLIGWRFDAGGGSINAGKALANHNVLFGLVALTGENSLDRLWQASFAAREILPIFVQVPGFYRRVNIHHVVDGEMLGFMAGPGERIPPGAVDELKRSLERLLDRSPLMKWFLMTSSERMILENKPDLFRSFLEVSHRHNVPALIDFNTTSSPEEILAVLNVNREEPLDILAPNVEEFARILNAIPSIRKKDLAASDHEAGEMEDLARRLMRAYHLQAVLIKRGPKGLVLVLGDRVIDEPGIPVRKVESPMGAGDATNAGLAMALANGESWEKAAEQANRFGAATVTLRGSQVATPRAVQALEDNAAGPPHDRRTGLEEGKVRAAGRGRTPEERVKELEGELKKASLNLSEASEALQIGKSDWVTFHQNGVAAQERAGALFHKAMKAAADIAQGKQKEELLERLASVKKDLKGLEYKVALLDGKIEEFRGTQELRRIKTRRRLRDLFLRTSLPWWGRLILGGGLAAALVSGYVARDDTASLENRNQPLSVRGFGEESAPVVRLAHSTEDLAGFKFPEGQKAQWFWFRQTNLYWLLLSGEDPNERFVYANRFAQAEGAPGISGAVFLPLQTLVRFFNSDPLATGSENGLLRDLLRMKLLVREGGRFQPAYPDPGAVVITQGAAGLAGPYGHIHKVIGDREPGYLKSSHPPEGVLSPLDEPKGGLEEERRAPLTRDGLDRYL